MAGETHVVITGTFSGSADFGAGEPGDVTLSVPWSGQFLARYATDGSFSCARVAAQGAGAAGGGGFQQVGVGSSGAIVGAGLYAGSDVVVGPGDAGETTLSADGFEDLLVAAFSGLGGP